MSDPSPLESQQADPQLESQSPVGVPGSKGASLIPPVTSFIISEEDESAWYEGKNPKELANSHIKEYDEELEKIKAKYPVKAADYKKLQGKLGEIKTDLGSISKSKPQEQDIAVAESVIAKLLEAETL